MGYFYILTFIIGFGAIMLVGANPAFKDAAGQLIGGNNMAAVHLADAVGGNLFLGFISAVAFATILAVVAGLTLAGASAVCARPVRQRLPQGRDRASGAEGLQDHRADPWGGGHSAGYSV